MIVFAVETFADIEPEILTLWPAHYREASEDQDAIPFAMDVERYRALDASGHLLVLTARSVGALVGYVVALIGTHIHSKDTIQAVCDLHYLAPQCRGGRTALRLFEAFEVAAKARGAVRLMAGTPVARSQERLFARLGWRPIEITHSKVIGGAA